MRISFFILFFFASVAVSAQVRFESEQDKDGNVSIYAINSDVIPYTVVLDFTSLTNLTSSGGQQVFATANPGKSTAARLKRSDDNQGTSYRYSTITYRGSFQAKIKEEPIYLIPVKQGQEVRMQAMTHLENIYNKEADNKSYVGTAFYFEQQTDVCAPRKGIISNMNMSSEVKGKSLSFNAMDNFIEIYHEDGTFTRLMVLEAGSEKVKIGDTVFPGQIIASSAGEKYQAGRHVRMVQSRMTKVGTEIKLEQFPVKIFAGEEEVSTAQTLHGLQVSHPEYLIYKEMSKRELKRMESN